MCFMCSYDVGDAAGVDGLLIKTSSKSSQLIDLVKKKSGGEG